MDKSTTVNRFVLHTLQRNITHLAVITRKTNIKLGILKGGGTGKEPNFQVVINMSQVPIELDPLKARMGDCSINPLFPVILRSCLIC